jgi:hypothetical protein
MLESENDLTMNVGQENPEYLSNEQCEKVDSQSTDFLEIADETADNLSGGRWKCTAFRPRRNKLRSLFTKPSPTIDFSSSKSLIDKRSHLP